MKRRDIVFLLLVVLLKARVSSWPQGQYCLPMPVNQACPVAWEKGYRDHDLEDDVAVQEQPSQPRDIGRDVYVSRSGQNLGWGFCCKTGVRYLTVTTWPQGQYCIFRKGGFCPPGFQEGSVFWDDEDTRNINNASGTLPDGVYDENTQMYFCCRDDGPRHLSGLPLCYSLALIKYKGLCPTMSGYIGPYSEYLDWNTEDISNNDQRIHVHPDGVSKFESGIRIEFCTYISSWSC